MANTRRLILLLMALYASSDVVANDALLPAVQNYVAERTSEFDQISTERKQQLTKLADFVRDCQKSGEPTNMVFICTHNSRRSHMSQLWAAVAAAHFGLSGVETFSGGTEATAFNPRAIAAMERAGLEITKQDESANPKYRVTFAKSGKPQICFSKKYSDSPNPKKNFCAVMTCTSADKNCPNVGGASARIAIPFEDPKVADGTAIEAAKYDERAAQIARELLYAFSRVTADAK